MIVFTKQKKGDRYRAQIDEIELLVDGIGYELTVYRYEVQYPCDYGDCPTMGLAKEKCDAGEEDCPAAEKVKQICISDLNNSFDNLAAVEAYLRNRMKQSWVKNPARAPYPKAAADRFAYEEWRYSE